jgi:hypothetical protein
MKIRQSTSPLTCILTILAASTWVLHVAAPSPVATSTPTPVNADVVAGREPGVKIPANPAFAPFSVNIYGFPME